MSKSNNLTITASVTPHSQAYPLAAHRISKKFAFESCFYGCKKIKYGDYMSHTRRCVFLAHHHPSFIQVFIRLAAKERHLKINTHGRGRMKNTRGNGRYDNQDNIDIELRGAYERGRRDQRGRPNGQPPPVFLLICSTLVVALLLLMMVRPSALNFGSHGPEPASVGDGSGQPANASEFEPSDSQPRKTSGAVN